ncbi:MAG: flagellar biosynthetic protein FliO [Planctomycetota bacterium]|nr:flagellar biosynthetic protein FliO [Planctomycetota bacterium]
MKPSKDIIACGGEMAGILRASILLLALSVSARAQSAASEKLAVAGPPSPSERVVGEALGGGGSLETIPIVQRSGVSAVSGRGTTSVTSVFNAWRIVGALGIVLGAIFGVRWLGRRFFGLPTARSSSGAIQVLGRSILSPKQQLMLVQVGRRIVLVADCGAQMNALCEISDPDEVAALSGQIQQRKGDSMSSSFLSFLGRAEAPYGASGPVESEDQEQESSGPDAGVDTPETAVAATREELSGLLQKVRQISRHFRRA